MFLFGSPVQKEVGQNLIFLLFKINFFIFLNYFDVLILK